MKLEFAKLLVEASEELECPIDLRENYSGRGMFGKVTSGVVGGKEDIQAALIKAAYNLGQNNGDIDGFLEETSFRWDNMGHDFIAY